MTQLFEQRLEALAERLRPGALRLALEPADDDVPAPSLNAWFPAAGFDDGVEVSLLFLPGHEALLNRNAALLQAYAELDFSVSLRAVPALLDAICRVNHVVPVGHFGYARESGAVYWKHLGVQDLGQPVDSFASVVDLQLGLGLHVIGALGGALADVAQHRSTPLQALSRTAYGALFER